MHEDKMVTKVDSKTNIIYRGSEYDIGMHYC